MTWKVKDAYPLPLALGAGVKVRLLICPTATTSPLLTVLPFRVSDPSPVMLVMVTDWKPFGLGSSSGSVKPKSDASKVYMPSSRTAIVLLLPAGA